MAGRYKSKSSRDIAEQRFRFRVDIRVPPHGLGQRLNEMHHWCGARLPMQAWASHGRSERVPGQVPVDYSRFYFDDEAAADAFRREWLKE